MSPEELEDLEQREMFIHDQRNAVRLALRQGLERGIEQGIKQGIEQGDRQAQRRIAQELLNLLDDATISQTTGLSLAEVQALRQAE